MSIDLLNLLIDLAEETDDLQAFLKRVRAITTLEEAERAVSLEFESLERFHAWVWEKKAQCEKKRVVEKGSPAITPRVGDIRFESGILRAELEPLLFELDELTNTIVPNLTDFYMLAIGVNEVELRALELENKRTLRSIDHARKALDRDEKPDMEGILTKVDIELAPLRAKLDADKKKIEKAKMRRHFQMSAGDSREFKRLYRMLIRKLNPQINPSHGERERELWARMQKAYAKGDIEEMRLLEILAEDVPDETPLQNARAGMASWESCQENLQEKLSEVKENIQRIKSEFPYTIKDSLANEAWIEEKNRDIRERIVAEIKTKELCDMTLRDLLKAIGKQ
jgi:hypothetical protein